ncbi:hypothetical protein F2Q68_00020916 [Brassica cretica]|uniref:No apical meristem-associated C-terminal domain-containing protein n=1 Tax=Brassica cretica TaxID=69181 RepID=A0A8S9FP69_BRACR|nr:hypothetical protein F2Q68_00020916 [Brassica cretica]
MATVANPAPAKKSRNSRKALKQKNEIVESPLLSPAKGKETKSYEKDLMEMQAMKIEKEKTEDLLKEKDEILRKKEEELETRDVEQEKLKAYELGEEERQMYNGKAAELMEAYKKEVEEYNKTKAAA